LLEAGDPTIIPTSPKTSAQTPSFNVSLGHFCVVGGVVGVVEGVGGGGQALGEGGGGLGLGFGVGDGLHVPQA
jgi:hypothetical protein